MYKVYTKHLELIHRQVFITRKSESFLSLHLSFYPPCSPVTDLQAADYLQSCLGVPALVFGSLQLPDSSAAFWSSLVVRNLLFYFCYNHQLKPPRGRRYCRPLFHIPKSGYIFTSVPPLDYLAVLILLCLTSGSARFALSASRLRSNTTLALLPRSPTDVLFLPCRQAVCLSCLHSGFYPVILSLCKHPSWQMTSNQII